MTKQEVSRIVAMIVAAYPNSGYSPATTEVWAGALDRYEYDDVRGVVDAMLRNSPRAPVLADIVALVRSVERSRVESRRLVESGRGVSLGEYRAYLERVARPGIGTPDEQTRAREALATLERFSTAINDGGCRA